MPAYLEILRRHGFTFDKAKGQNFLVAPGVCPRMAAAGAAAGVLEIGPGAGALTRELAKSSQKVVAVELDKRLLPVLDETLAGLDNVTIIPGDILALDLPALLKEQFAGMPVSVCANLPYYITSPVLMRLLELRLPLSRITVMVQKEAAQRLCAPMGTRACGAVTAVVEYFTEAKQLFPVSRSSFVPPPKVDSAVIQLTLRDAPAVAVADEAAFFRLVRAAFGQRRKTLANAVSAGLSLEKSRVQEALARAGIPQTARAEELTLQNFAALFEQLGTDAEKSSSNNRTPSDTKAV
ncbi:MAG: 16S rRNA (adenine(1518)-N(6)/adenine(1519)-N(6))-dimethyltransferase RsmA [Oscillospiraceae bacterium]|jgi:16S rRNA (adenine1518-N6/adenine1519-N6)-dimethyltransferase|nr:16S rRNA (adenine(1518)-N(6)/adenine(1519)-N(6))-dimethyltransferase RsmA [Oscillospiraceae bacterium]